MGRLLPAGATGVDLDLKVKSEADFTQLLAELAHGGVVADSIAWSQANGFEHTGSQPSPCSYPRTEGSSSEVASRRVEAYLRKM